MAAPSREAILNLYHNMLRTSQSFSSYNFRQYFTRRTKNTFRAMQEERDTEKLRILYAEAVKDQAVLHRSAMVNQLYGGWRVALEARQAKSQPEAIKEERSDS